MRKFLGTSLAVDTQIICESKADATYPVVSAASICAKVSRDQLLRDWRFFEQEAAHNQKERRDSVKLPASNVQWDDKFGREFGCGYPSDPKTKEWLQKSFDPVFGFPSIVRFSWKTCVNVLESNHAMADWKDPDPNKVKNQAILQVVQKDRRKNNVAVKRLGISRKFEI